MTTLTPMARAPASDSPRRFDLHIPPALGLDEEALFAVCQANRELRIERNAEGDLEIMPPTGAETGIRNSDINRHLGNWAEADGRGIVFDSSTGFLLPDGAMRSPDAAWVRRDRLSALTPAQKRGFLPLAPDLVIELASPNDDPRALRAKMTEWRDNGVRLGWLILPDQRQVWRYPADANPEQLDNPATLDDAHLLPGLRLPLARIWEPLF